MRQVNKSKFYISSANRATGTTGNFKICTNIPLAQKGNFMYKIYPLNIMFRNDMPWTTTNDTVNFQFNGLPHYYTLPLGCPSITDIVTDINSLYSSYFTVAYSTISATLTFTPSFLYPTTVTMSPTAAVKLGFTRGNYAYSASSSSPLTSEVAVQVNPYMFVDVCTNIPRHNWSMGTSTSILSNTDITTRVPLTVPFMATQVYVDYQGANAMYESFRDHLDTVHITMKDYAGNVLAPQSDWYLCLCVETWVDDGEQQTQYLAQIASATGDVAADSRMNFVKDNMDTIRDGEQGQTSVQNPFQGAQGPVTPPPPPPQKNQPPK
jgi:hypothetical protein